MKRFIIDRLTEWKESPLRKPLILLGARQVGKTWVMKEFGRTHYENYAYLNCDDEPMAKNLFAVDYDIKRILLTIQAITHEKIEAGKTLLIIDEIQESPRALHALKYFCENAPEYHVIAAGSLLGVTLGSKESYPVGKVNMMRLYPMSFEEFLLAAGEEGCFNVLHEGDWQTVQLLHSKLVQMLRQYYFTGGMPEAVADFIENQNLANVRSIQAEILSAYKMDIAKHATKSEAVRITQILDSMPSQLVKENRKFIYGVIKEGARASSYELAIQWLIDAGIAYKVPRVKTLKMPLKAYLDANSFKLFMLDCGLLGCMANVPASQIIASDNMLTEYKGAFTEQYVHQQLISIGLEPHYWSNDRTPAEIDFVVQQEEQVIPIEVKAEENVRSRSMAEYIKNNPELNLKGLRISMKGFIDQGWMVNIPLYAVEGIIRQTI